MQRGAYRSVMKMRRRSDVSTAVIASAVIVVLVILIAAYAVYSSRSPTVTATTTVTGTTTVTSASTGTSTLISTAISTSTSTVTTTVSSKEGPLVSWSADAYAPEVTALLDNFSSSTGVQTAPLTSGGSTADAAAIAAGAPDDVFVSSSLGATSSQYLGNLTANWSIGFATDQMVLAYSNSTTQTSATKNIISLGSTATQSNATSDWNNFYTALVSGTVKVGISDPTQDPGGLRGWLALEAAGYLYSGGNTQSYVNTLLKDQDNVTAASAANLVAPLQAGDIQFLFTYKSAAVSDGLPYITLDSHVNLGSASLASFYAKFSYTDSAGTTKAAPIVIAVTIPLSAVNTAEALQFVEYVVQNSKSLSTFGVVPLSPCILYENTPPPAAIQQLVTQGLLVNGGALA
jgi:molybdate/tungstate transport system substrate-binding protein